MEETLRRALEQSGQLVRVVWRPTYVPSGTSLQGRTVAPVLVCYAGSLAVSSSGYRGLHGKVFPVIKQFPFFTMILHVGSADGIFLLAKPTQNTGACAVTDCVTSSIPRPG